MSFIVGSIIIGGGLSLAGTGIQAGSSLNQAKKQERQSRISRAEADAFRFVADKKRKQADVAAQEQYREQEGIRKEQLAGYKSLLGNQLTQYNNLGNQGLPSASIQYMQQGAERAAASQVQGAESARNALAGAQSGGQTLRDAYSQIGSMDAQQRLKNKQLQAEAQGLYADQIYGAETDFQNWNQAAYSQAFIDPQYAEASMMYGEGNRSRDYAAALEGASMQNRANAWSNLGATLTQLGGYGIGYGMNQKKEPPKNTGFNGANLGGYVDPNTGRDLIPKMPTIKPHI